MSTLRDTAAVTGIGETRYERGTVKSALQLTLAEVARGGEKHPVDPGEKESHRLVCWLALSPPVSSLPLHDLGR